MVDVGDDGHVANVVAAHNNLGASAVKAFHYSPAEGLRELATRYTIVIVTHNMQQASRISDDTAFMLLGDLVEFAPTSAIFTHPEDKRTLTYRVGPCGHPLGGGASGIHMQPRRPARSWWCAESFGQKLSR